MADHTMSENEHHGAMKKSPPGKPHGEFMSQKGSLSSPTNVPLLKRLAKRELLPIIPLFVAVAGGVALAGWSATRNLTKVPEVGARLNKERRAGGMPELEDPEMVSDMGKRYLEKTLIRDTIRHPFFDPVFRFMTIPSLSRGDEALQKDAQIKGNKMTLETGKGHIQT